MFNMISFVNTQGSVKIRLACSKALLLTISASNMTTHSNGYISKVNKYSFFYKSRCGKYSPETKLFTQSNSRPVWKQLIPTIKQSTFVELPSSDKGKFTTKNKYILSAVQQPRNEIPAEKNRRKKRQLRKFQDSQLQESVENQFELSSPSQRTKGQEINIFYGNFLHLLPFLQQKLFITFSSIGFQTMSLKRTIRYSIFLISFITSVSFLNSNPAFNSIDRNPVDAGLRLGLHETFRRRHGRPLSTSCALNLCPVTTGKHLHWFFVSKNKTYIYRYHIQTPESKPVLTTNYYKVWGIQPR